MVAYVLGGLEPAWTVYCTGVLSVLEGEVGIICTCIPTLMPLYRMGKQFLTSSYGRYWTRSYPQTTLSLETRPIKDQSSWGLDPVPYGIIKKETIFSTGPPQVPDGYIKKETSFSIVTTALEEKKIAF